LGDGSPFRALPATWAGPDTVAGRHVLLGCAGARRAPGSASGRRERHAGPGVPGSRIAGVGGGCRLGGRPACQAL